ncbi:DUF2336 domain-containing protein [Tianweitania sediminis]|uniref:DUF2336 domain-containing protein n=1 Tax=Tianweitania sediminis TaxID=1502156 RepID=A0A8J7R242_9HYPH|nr:DUF2336 domain-containing protein [Tianweitania sediminis]
MSQEFRQLARKQETGRSDRLFRAAISAFCALTRPSRRDIVQLEDLCLQLYDAVSAETLRYVSAVLSECAVAPAGIVRRLADEAIEIAAPLLLKSQALTEVDLVAIIGRHGASHARVVAQRSRLTPPVASVVERVRSSGEPGTRGENNEGQAAAETREILRGMMRPSRTRAEGDAEAAMDAVYEKLRSTALTGSLPFFQTALADVLEIEYRQARSIVAGANKQDLLRILKALGLTQEQAFLLTSAVRPQDFGHGQAIRAFLSAFEAISADEAVSAVRLYQADAVYSGVTQHLAGNGNLAKAPTRRSVQAA